MLVLNGELHNPLTFEVYMYEESNKNLQWDVEHHFEESQSRTRPLFFSLYIKRPSFNAQMDGRA